MHLTRRGFALAEALVAVILTTVLLAAALGGLTALQRALGRQVARTSRAQTLRAALQLGVAELQDLAPPAGDVVALTANGVIYRAVRATGLACGRSTEGLLMRSSSFRALRTPSPGRDSVAVLVRPDAWAVVGLEADPRAGSCPDGAPALTLPISLLSPDPLAALTWPAPAMITEVMELRAYQSGSEWWLGLRSVSSGETIQPALGPLAPGGFAPRALDSLGGPTASLPDIRQLILTFRLPSGDSLVRSLSFSPGGWP